MQNVWDLSSKNKYLPMDENGRPHRDGSEQPGSNPWSCSSRILYAECVGSESSKNKYTPIDLDGRPHLTAVDLSSDGQIHSDSDTSIVSHPAMHVDKVEANGHSSRPPHDLWFVVRCTDYKTERSGT